MGCVKVLAATLLLSSEAFFDHNNEVKVVAKEDHSSNEYFGEDATVSPLLVSNTRLQVKYFILPVCTYNESKIREIYIRCTYTVN